MEDFSQPYKIPSCNSTYVVCLVWFICLEAYQLLMGYLKSKLD